MSTYSGKEIFWDIASALVGVVAGILSSVIVAFILMYLGLLGWTDGGSPEELARLDRNTEISLFILVIVASMVAGLITALVASGHYLRYSIIAGAILLLIWLSQNDFDFPREDNEKIMTLLILPLCIVGGWLGHSLKIKRQKNKQLSS